ncbi:kelch repeat-containing protein [Archangium minus]|uniref:Kelch repeat-containing protein n=1 Tax=Archangium minus TaxID=83450 RepID=UPI0037C04E65
MDGPRGQLRGPTQASTTWTAPMTQGVVKLSLTVSDSRGAALTVSLTVTVSAGSGAQEVRVDFNTVPGVVGLTSSQSVLDVGQQTALSVSASDADGDTLSYQWSATCAGSFSGATSSSATFTPSALPTGACNNCQLSVVVKDGRGGQNTGSLALCVSKDTSPRAAPLVTRSYQSSPTARAGQQLTFEVEASDPSNSALTFAWTANVGTLGPAVSSASISRISWTAPTCVTSSTTPSLTATVTNAFGLTDTEGFTVTLPACIPATWVSTGSMAASRSEFTTTLLSTGKVLVAGGWNGDDRLLTAELYDPTTGKWSPTGSMSSRRTLHSATLLPSGKVLVAGGYGTTSLATAELYDPATGKWSPTGSMASVRYFHTATLLPSGKVLVAGGYGTTSLATAELYDPATGTWSPTGSLATPHYWHTATLLPSGKVLVTGGLGGIGAYLATAELYDPATGTWSPTGAMASARYQHRATLLPSGKVLVTGGENTNSLAMAELYDPATGTWSPTGNMTIARYNHAATLLPNGQVLVVAGRNYYGNQVTAELYEPATGTWRLTSAPAVARQWHPALLLPSGKVLVVGGYNGMYLVTAELYDPGTSN